MDEKNDEKSQGIPNRKSWLKVLFITLSYLIIAWNFGTLYNDKGNMETIDIIFVILVVLFLLIYFILLYYLSYRVKKKGYKSPWITALLIYFPSMAGFLFGFFSFPLIADANMGLIFYVEVFVYIFALTIFAGLASTIIVLLLPRKKRIPGRRIIRFPYFKVGVALIVIELFLSMLNQVYKLGTKPLDLTAILISAFASLNTWYFVILIALFCFYMARRAKLPSMTEVISKDDRPSVLYLRPFIQEEESFLELTSYLELTKREAWSYISNPFQRVTFEIFFSKEITKSIGPFIALGNPEDYATPDGAARMYMDDRGWMKQFKDLSFRAACILMEMGQSENLKWELKFLREDSLQEKLFIITRPRKKKWSKINFYIDRIDYFLKGIKPVSWAQLAENLNRAGYFLNIADLGPGSVLTFDSKCIGVLLTANAYLPSDFIMAIQKWRIERKAIGEFKPIICANCGKDFSMPSSETVEDKNLICSNCKQKCAL